MSVDNSRQGILKRFREQIARGEPIIGGGAGTGLSAMSEEAGGIDLLIVYNSGRYRMAGRGSSAGLLAYGNANQIVKEMAYEVLPVVKKTPVLAGVNGTDPFIIPQALPRGAARRSGFAGIQNFPTVGLFDGDMRQAFEETGMSYQLEVDIIRLARELDLLTTPYVFNPSEAERMADAGADLIVAHMGVTTGGSIGAKSSKTLDDCVDADPADRRRGARREPGRARHLPRRADLGAARRGIHHHEVPRRRRLLRRELGRAPAGRARHRRADPDVQEHSAARIARAHRRASREGRPMSATRSRRCGSSRRRRRASSSRRGASTGGCRSPA